MAASSGRRSRRLVVATVGLAVLMVGTGFAWYVAAGARTPGQRAAEAAPPPPSVLTATVTGGELVDSVSLPGVFARANSVPVRGPATVSVGRAVVTKLPVAAGDPVANGTLIAEVSGRPLIALAGAFPAYRDLAEGDKGPDVAQLQTALRARYRTPVTSVFDARTATDLRKLYQALGYDVALGKPAPPPADAPQAGEPPPTPPPAETVRLPASEVAFVPDLPATVGTLGARVGDDANAVLLTLTSGAWQVVAKLADGLDQAVGGLTPDTRLVLGAGPGKGKPAKLVTVRPIAAPQPAKTDGGRDTGAAPTATPDSGPGNRATSEAVFAVDGEPAGVAAGQAQEIVLERQRSPAGTVVVPVSALSTRADGTVEVTIVDGAARRPVVVEVRMSFQGQAAVVATSGRLAVGDAVLVGQSGR